MSKPTLRVFACLLSGTALFTPAFAEGARSKATSKYAVITCRVPLSPTTQHQIFSTVQDVVSEYPKNFRGRAPNAEMVQLGIYLVYARNADAFQDVKGTYDLRLAAHFVEDMAEEVFGVKVKPRSVGDWKYRNGYYYGSSVLFEQSGDETIQHLTITGASPNSLTVNVSYENSMATADSPSTVYEKARLNLKKVTAQGHSRYIVTSFHNFAPH